MSDKTIRVRAKTHARLKEIKRIMENQKDRSVSLGEVINELIGAAYPLGTKSFEKEDKEMLRKLKGLQKRQQKRLKEVIT